MSLTEFVKTWSLENCHTYITAEELEQNIETTLAALDYKGKDDAFRNVGVGVLPATRHKEITLEFKSWAEMGIFM